MVVISEDKVDQMIEKGYKVTENSFKAGPGNAYIAFSKNTDHGPFVASTINT